MLLLMRPSFRLLPRTIQRRAYSSAPPPVLKVHDTDAKHCGKIRTLSLNRPAARNAISRELLAALKKEVKKIADEPENGPTRALILASEDNQIFCAGADLKERANFTEKDTADFLASLRSTLTMIQNLQIPTISALGGSAYGGGLELALATHFRVFASNITVALPETRLAIIPGAGGTYRLPALIGLARARDIILTGRRVGAPEAYFLGLCDRLIDIPVEDLEKSGSEARDKTLKEAISLAQDICDGGPIAIKAALLAVQGCALGEQAENAAYDLVLKTKDRNEALAAFREKRKPKYRGH